MRLNPADYRDGMSIRAFKRNRMPNIVQDIDGD